MALLETLTIQVGAALVKAAAKLWLKDRPFADAAAGTLIDGLKKKIEDFATRDSAETLLRNIRGEVGRRLEAFLAIEFPGAAENELEAAAHAVADAFDTTALGAMAVAADLDPERLQRTLDADHSARFAKLGGIAADAARAMLAESCRYVVTIVGKLPDFEVANARELLKRDREILEAVTKALQAVAALHERDVANDRRDGRSFERNYRVTLINGLDRMDLFGVRLIGGGARDYGLTIAYVTLSATAGTPPQPQAVDDALTARSALVIRGEAGSGKTTLMQWLAVRAASRDFLEPLAEWNERLPFYVRLRDFAGARLPQPEQFLESAARNLVGVMPTGWIYEMLAGKALLLLDGLDELPANRRQEFFSWLRDLKRDFPAAVIIITSRPAALDAEQPLALGKALAALDFTSLTLEPMTLADSQALVAQWHAAVARDRPDDRDKLIRYERDLQQALHDRSAIRALAANPLLCAMMCVLNWDRRQQLPDDRMELYRLALEVLLERRESEREIKAVHLADFDRKDKEAILDDLAYWMLRNGLSEAPQADAVRQIALALRRMGRLQGATPGAVLQELLERSGLLRQPQPDVVSFIHRTFLEYMAARAALAADDVGVLVDRAKEESWRETIVFACGHATGVERDQLVRNLLRKPWFRHRPIEAEVTAACCLETAARSLEPGLLQELRERAARLFPPRDPETALLLRPAAEMDPTLLRGHADKGSAAVAACIRTAAAVGGSPMLDVIAEYATVAGDAVDLEIAQAWDAFDEDVFLERVVQRRATLFGIAVATLDVEAFACLRVLIMTGQHRQAGAKIADALAKYRATGELRVAATTSRPKMPDAPRAAEPRSRHHAVRSRGKRDLARLVSLRTLAISTSDPDIVAVIGQAPHLAELILRVDKPLDLAPLARLKTLTALDIAGAGARDLRPAIAGLALTSLTVRNAPVETLSAVPLAATLRTLAFEFLPRLDRLEGLASARQLRSLRLTGSAAAIGDWLEQLTELEELEITFPKAGVAVDWSRLAALGDVWLQGLPHELLVRLDAAPALHTAVLSLSPRAPGMLRFGATVERLTVFGNESEAMDFATVPAGSRLSYLVVKDFRELRNADRIADLPALQYLALEGNGRVQLSPDARRRLTQRLPQATLG